MSALPYHAMSIADCVLAILNEEIVPEKPKPRQSNILRLVAWLLAILHIS